MVRPCDVCGTEYEAKRSTSKYCSDACRKQAQRTPIGASDPEPEGVTDLSGLGAVALSTLTALIKADVQFTPAGMVAMRLADRLDHPERDTGSAIAAVAREHAARLDAALALTKVVEAGDPIDELAARRGSRSA